MKSVIEYSMFGSLVAFIVLVILWTQEAVKIEWVAISTVLAGVLVFATIFINRKKPTV